MAVWNTARVSRLLYFTRDYTTHDRRFLCALAETWQEVYYLRLEQRGHALEDRPLPPQVRIVPWAGGQRPATLRDGPRLLMDLRRVIREIQPDLIQAGPLQTAAFLTALAGFHPLVSMSWGYDLLIDARRSKWWAWATRFTLQHSDAMMGDCDTIRQQAIAFGMRPDRIVAFPWGIDLERFTPLPTAPCPLVADGSAERYFTLLSTRGWEPLYGVDVIARAFVQAARSLAGQGGPQLRLIMLGNGSLASWLRQTFLQGGVLDQVLLPGQISQADLPRYYRSADLYLSASHSDGSSISLMEAMACGRPALVSDIPGNREWVEPGVNGWWFPDGDAEALAQAILQAVPVKTTGPVKNTGAQHQRLVEMGRAARRVVEQRGDWPNNFRKLSLAYEIAIRR